MQATQGSYIGNTTASQAVKAGSIPVPCSKKDHPTGGVFFWSRMESKGRPRRRWGKKCPVDTFKAVGDSIFFRAQSL